MTPLAMDSTKDKYGIVANGDFWKACHVVPNLGTFVLTIDLRGCGLMENVRMKLLKILNHNNPCKLPMPRLERDFIPIPLKAISALHVEVGIETLNEETWMM